MRFYRITLTDPKGIYAPIVFSSLDEFGNFNPGALQVEFDIPITGFSSAQSGAYVRIWGIGLQDISQANDLNDFNISIEGGMSSGLPLAKPEQQGVLFEGYVFQAYGNWMGSNQYIDLNLYSKVGSASDIKNLSLNWKAGMPLGQAIENTMSIAFPGYAVDISGLSPNLVVNADQAGYYATLPQFADFIKRASLLIGPATADGSPYSGAQITLQGKKFTVADNHGSWPDSPKQLFFEDLIGQPTWINANQVQFNCVLRGDLAPLMYLQLPQIGAITGSNSLSRFRQRSVFQGPCRILGGDSLIRHVGNFRQADAQAWITTVNAFLLTV
jgi:hypothetical protein